MPLKGEAKKLYQREYMRHYMRGLRSGTEEEWNQDKTCEACGHYGVVDNHHKDKNHDNNDKSNRVFLCPNCHALIHRRGKTLDEIRTVKTHDKTIDKLRQTIKNIENRAKAPQEPSDEASLPLYNPALHGPGDRVLMNYGKKLIETIIPTLDADGNPMPE